MMKDTENIVPIQTSKPVSGNGGRGDDRLIIHRLGEVERRVSTLESKLDDIKDTCMKISAKMEEVPSKSQILWRTIGLAFMMLMTLFGHLLIRNIGAL